MMLYAQVTQVDGHSRRNVLVARVAAEPQAIPTGSLHADDLLECGVGRFAQIAVTDALSTLGLPLDSHLSVIAVDLLPEPEVGTIPQPLGVNLGQVRILRTSPLAPVPTIC